MKRPLCIDGFCGLGGWAEGFLKEGWDVIGFDIEQHVYGEHRYPSLLVIQDVMTLHGSQFKNADCLVFSPPCQEYSYMAMPWSRGKAIAAEYRSGVRDVKKLTALFDACFRIQREACEAAGRHIPMVVENVRGAIPWVGRSAWNYGSFHLWGDVPALMPMRSGGGVKVPGMSWSGHPLGIGPVNPNYKAVAFNGRRTDPGNGARFTSRDCGVEGVKQRGSGRELFAGEGNISRTTSSKSSARKMASAMIAKIPEPLSQWIARAWWPHDRFDYIATRASP